jgi:hypothetical protein
MAGKRTRGGGDGLSCLDLAVSDKERLLVVLLLGGLAVTALGGLGPPPLNTSGTSSSKGGVQGVVEVLCERGYRGRMLVSQPGRAK